MTTANPALEAFLDSFLSERVWAEVWIERCGQTFQLRNVKDRTTAVRDLERLAIAELRKLVTYNSNGQFRPLHAAPDLRAGWICFCRDGQELWRAMQELYPGSIPDWFAGVQGDPPVTHYREFTGRQSGMYRITQLLTDEQAANVTRACCPPHFCLKQRLWTVPGLPPDPAESKSAIPCLEPCAVLLELARKSARIEQEEKIDVELTRSDLETFLSAAKFFAGQGSGSGRVGDIGSPANPRRVQLVVEKYGLRRDDGGQKREED